MKRFILRAVCLAMTMMLSVTATIMIASKVKAADNTKITDKVIAGYQAWFFAEGDNSPWNEWVHWGEPEPRKLTFEVFPDVRDYSLSSLFQTKYANLGNGQQTKLFSSYPQDTIDKHFKWMQQYGIDGVGVQRFARNTIPGTQRFDQFKEILKRIRKSAEEYDRIFYVMYDISGFTNETLVDGLKNDWKDTVIRELDLTSSPNYAKQDGKPVVSLWGLGVSGRPGTPEQYLDIIDWFKKQGYYVIGGVKKDWRHSMETDKMEKVYKSLDMISPWSVGSYSSDKDIDDNMNQNLIPDRDYCKANGIDYQPVFFPGFAWSNWNGGVRNQIPRRNGEFMWRQAYDIRRADIPGAYIAMFDEYDEGTNIAKMAEDSSMIPQDQYFLTSSAEGTYISSDFYLRLAGKASKMIKGIDPAVEKVPIPYTEGPVFFRSSFEKNTDAQMTWQNEAEPNGIMNILGIGGSGKPKCETVIDEQANRGNSAIKISGNDVSESKSFANFKAIDMNIAVQDGMTLSYSFYPANELGRYVSIDLVAADGSRFRDSQAVDFNGISMSPAAGHGTVGLWNQIQSDIGKWMKGKTIQKLVISYENEKLTGDFAAYIDDVIISTQKSDIDTFGVVPGDAPKNVGYARALYTLGLFEGTSDMEYQPELTLPLNKEQAVKLILTVLGKKKEAEQASIDCPFTDVSEWARAYVGYAAKMDIARGVSDSLFGANQQVTTRELLVFYLRALGYGQSGMDLYPQAGQEALKVGLLKDISQTYDLDKKQLRGDAVGISYRALLATRNGSNKVLLGELQSQKVVDAAVLMKELDLYEAYTASLKPPAKVILKGEIDNNLMRIVINDIPNKGDSYTRPEQIDGVESRLIPEKQYMYCQVEDSYIKAGDSNLTIKITFYDQGTDAFTIHYNSKDTTLIGNAMNYKPVTITRTGTDTWKTVSIDIADANFQNKQNSGADFRISGPNLYVSEVEVEKKTN